MKSNPSTASEAMSKARLRLWLKLLKATQVIEAELRRRLREEYKTTLPRFDVLSALARHQNGLKMSELSTYLRVSNGNVTGIVDRLMDDGLVLRVAIEGDRRAHLARLTPKGCAVFKDLAEKHEAWVDELLGTLSPEEADTIRATLSKLEI